MRRQLALVFLATSALVALAFVVPLAALVQRTVADRAIDAARADASAVVPSLISENSRAQIEDAMALTSAGADGRMSILTSQGWEIGPEFEQSPRVDEALRLGVSDIGPVAGGMEVIAAVASAPEELSAIRVFVPRAMMWEGVYQAWSILAAIGVALVVISVVVADALARTVVRPTESLALAARRLGSGNLDARVEPTGPGELADLGEAFNRLGGQVSTMLARERELVADLSHRLRTPLTKLRLRIDHVEKPALAAELKSDVDDITAVVSEVIREARGSLDRGRSCDVAKVLNERVEFWRALAEDQRRQMQFELGETELSVAVDAVELAAVIDNLIDNAFVHTEEGTGMAIGCDQMDGMARIWINDDGPGFLSGFDVRIRGQSGALSTGLGLDIAQQLAGEAGGELTLATGVEGGARVMLTLPLVPSNSPEP